MFIVHIEAGQSRLDETESHHIKPHHTTPHHTHSCVPLQPLRELACEVVPAAWQGEFPHYNLRTTCSYQQHPAEATDS